jgi:uncharacterized protein YjhX (UPF0386 family)
MISRIDNRVRKKIEKEKIRRRKRTRKLSPITNYKRSAHQITPQVGDEKYIEIFKSLKIKRTLKNKTGRNYYVHQVREAIKEKGA